MHYTMDYDSNRGLQQANGSCRGPSRRNIAWTTAWCQNGRSSVVEDAEPWNQGCLPERETPAPDQPCPLLFSSLPLLSFLPLLLSPSSLSPSLLHPRRPSIVSSRPFRPFHPKWLSTRGSSSSSSSLRVFSSSPLLMVSFPPFHHLVLTPHHHHSGC